MSLCCIANHSNGKVSGLPWSFEYAGPWSFLSHFLTHCFLSVSYAFSYQYFLWVSQLLLLFQQSHFCLHFIFFFHLFGFIPYICYHLNSNFSVKPRPHNHAIQNWVMGYGQLNLFALDYIKSKHSFAEKPVT